MNLTGRKSNYTFFWLNIFTAVSVSLERSSVCIVDVDGGGSLAPSASINGFFCLRRTNSGDCFSGNGGITSNTVANTVGLHTSLNRRYSVARC